RAIVVDGDGAVVPVGRGDEAQPAALFTVGKVLLLVGGRHAEPGGLDPDLQEVRDALALVVVLAVAHAGAGAHALHVARHDGRAVAHGVLVPERAVEHVGDDLHVAMAVRAEAGPRLHAVLVDDAQRPVAHVPGVVVVRERKAVIRLEPAVLRVSALGGAPQLVHRPGSSPRRVASNRNQTRRSASSIHTSSRLAVATSRCSSHTECVSRIWEISRWLSSRSSASMSCGETKSASLSLMRCSRAMCAIERSVVPPSFRTRSATVSVAAKIWSACSSSSRW